ncbi:putative receptor-type tyrosine-protein phosphatase H, partial [Apostichopus japonicus]
GFHRPHEFIATQGPMEHTVNDFWRMIWEQQVPIVVMICDIIEGGKAKCEEYWPPSESQQLFGEIVVTTLSEKQTTKGREREFKIGNWRALSFLLAITSSLNGLTRGSQPKRHPSCSLLGHQESHTDLIWPSGCPLQNMTSHISFLCFSSSDGASRTGVFIALDIMMQALDNESDTLDVYGVVARLRKDRTNMVLSKHYYVFIHQAILDVLLAQVSDSNWSFGSSDTPTRYSYISVDDTNGLLAQESRL